MKQDKRNKTKTDAGENTYNIIKSMGSTYTFFKGKKCPKILGKLEPLNFKKIQKKNRETEYQIDFGFGGIFIERENICGGDLLMSHDLKTLFDPNSPLLYKDVKEHVIKTLKANNYPTGEVEKESEFTRTAGVTVYLKNKNCKSAESTLEVLDSLQGSLEYKLKSELGLQYSKEKIKRRYGQSEAVEYEKKFYLPNKIEIILNSKNAFGKEVQYATIDLGVVASEDIKKRDFVDVLHLCTDKQTYNKSLIDYDHHNSGKKNKRFSVDIFSVLWKIDLLEAGVPQDLREKIIDGLYK